MANNTLSGSVIDVEFGSNDSKRERTLVIANSNNLNFTYQINQLELCGAHVTLLRITFDEVTCAEFQDRASKTVISDNGNPLIRVLFTYNNNSSNISYIELNKATPTSKIPYISTTPSTTPRSDASTILRFDCYVTTITLSFSLYLLLLLF